ncbi:MAG TPA: ribosome biogenesis factor YjgA [Polyangiaceae bacterium]|jgi:ribosome-associated protein|nr:ribosome biogenesis factor YjgA [Polyangiaceae bacterium]
MSQSEDDDRERRSRTDVRRAEAAREEALARLARDLVALNERRLEQLELPDPVLDSVLDGKKMKSPAALNRQVRTIRIALRDVEWWLIRARLDQLLATGVADDRSGREMEWVVRLVGGGNDALDELLREHPGADRGHLRTLIRNVIKANAGRRQKAEQQLARTLRALLGA